MTLAWERYVRVLADQLNSEAAMVSRRFAPATQPSRVVGLNGRSVTFCSLLSSLVDMKGVYYVKQQRLSHRLHQLPLD